MCRCLQNLWEDFYWHCIEERFCFDENIAYYNPDEEDVAAAKKNALDVEFVGGGGGADKKNPEIIVNQPLARHCSALGAKAHEDDFQREIQTTVPILAPEVMAAFATSQIFNEHSQKPKGIAVEQEEQQRPSSVMFKVADEDLIAPKPKGFQSIAEEDNDEDDDAEDVVELRSKPLYREMSVSSQTLSPPTQKKRSAHQRLKHVQSVPQLPTFPSITDRPWSQAGETMTRDGIFIINTPELPAISLKKLPRNYLDTPSIDPYQPSSNSLTSIQMQNKQRGEEKFNFQMPRYYGRSEMYLPTPAISQEEIHRSNLRAAKLSRVSLKKNHSMVNLNQRSASPDPKSTSTHDISTTSTTMVGVGGGSGSSIGGDKSKRLKMLRGNLPPLMIHTSDKETPEKERH